MPDEIAIVGMGARGISVLERLAATADGRARTVHVIDPGPFGPGVHREDQHDSLLLNTVAGQITMFREGDPSADGVCVPGPSLAEWMDVARDTYLPRRLLGSYLRHCYALLCAAMPESVTIVEHHAKVEGMRRSEDDAWLMSLDDGSSLRADFVVLATGHGTLAPSHADTAAQEFAAAHADRNPALGYFRGCYPLEQLDAIAPQSRVGVRGMGLSAIDVVLTLTVERGGHFAGTGHDLIYVPSGAEPVIGVWSRHGRAFWPRARNEKSPADVHHPQALDLDRVRELRDQGQRDFAVDYVPMLAHELRTAAARIDPDASIEGLVELLSRPEGRETGDVDQRTVELSAFFGLDEERAEQGNLTNPWKAATDAIRDLRNEIRAAVEHAGLDPESHRTFVETYAPLLHVMSAGPPALRAREWRALLAAGILTLAPAGAEVVLDETAACFGLVGPDGERFDCDVIVNARVDAFLPDHDDATLTQSLLARGYARPYRNGDYHPGGWDIDEWGRLVDAHGDTMGNVCAVGNPTEGPHYFTNMLPAPGLASRITADAQHVIDALHEWTQARRSVSAGVTA